MMFYSRKPRLETNYSADVVRSCEDRLSKKNFAMLMAATSCADYPAIAAALGMPLGTVKSRLHRARAQMADLIRTSATKHPNGAPMFDASGMMLDEQGGRSIFDDVAE